MTGFLASDDDDLYPDDPYRGPEVHEFDPGPDGRCRGGWTNDRLEWVQCRSTQRGSVLHDDPGIEFDQMHDHGGGDCMCFEGPYDSYWGAREEYVRSRGRGGS